MDSVIDHINELLVELQSEEYFEREKAVLELGNYHDDEAIAGLVMAIEDVDPSIRELACDFLSKSKGNIASQLLIRFMGHEDISTRNLAAEILVKIGDEAVPYLMAEIDDEDHDVRKFVVDVLGWIKDERAVDVLCQKLWDENINVVCSAAESLGKIGSSKAIPALVAVYEKIEDARLASIEALGKIGDSKALNYLFSYLESDDPMVQYASVEALGKVGDKAAIENLLPLMNGKDKSYAEAAFKSVIEIYQKNDGKIGFDIPLDSFAPFLFEGIKNKDKELTDFTFARLKNWYGTGIIEGLLEVIDSADENYRARIIDSLTQVGPSVCNSILNSFSKQSPETKLLCLDVIKQFADEEIAKDLLAIVHDPDDRVRTKIVHILGISGYKESKNILSEMIKDDIGHVRAAAYAALGWVCTDDDIDLIIQGIYDEFPDVRSAAIGALIVVGGEKVAKKFYNILFEGDIIRQKLAIKVLSYVGDENVIEPLKLGLNNPEPELRRSSIIAISKLGDETVADSLKSVLDDEDSSVRKAAITSLITLKGSDAVEDIKYMLEDDDLWVVYHTISAIGSLKNEEHADLILPFLKSGEEPIIIATIKAVASLRYKKAMPLIQKFITDENVDIASSASESFKILKDI